MQIWGMLEIYLSMQLQKRQDVQLEQRSGDIDIAAEKEGNTHYSNKLQHPLQILKFVT